MNRTCIAFALLLTACGDSNSESVDAAAVDARAADAVPADAAADAMPLPFPAPVAYWTMDAADISAGVIADRIGDVDGTITGPLAESGGQIGGALVFDGTDDYVDFGDSLDSVFAGADKAFSVSVWAQPAAPTQARIMVAKTSDTNCTPPEDGRQWILALSDTNEVQFFYQPLASGSVQLITGEATAGAGWNHIAIVYDGSIDTAAADRLTVYVDGVEDTIAAIGAGFPFDLADSPAHLAIGDRVDSAGNRCSGQDTAYAGSVDEMAIWDEALDATDVGAIHARGLAATPLLP